ncbi:ISSth1, transposase orfC, IS3 family [Streptococcus gallolyticus]|uniref:ISSth1, transposase orfC, IS3 family n=1 Tax=Streptococcus gallolyticus TaxID=315405 RepID=A0AA94M156_9STRE|nr:ISSth1, transposase orfC, IS3 family [Streptococcus gallolyticus]
MTRFMSRVGKCIDNTPIESFYGHFKTEAYDYHFFPTYESLAEAVDNYFYNSERYQSTKKQPDSFRIQESGCLKSFIISLST